MVEGQRAYRLARLGQSVELSARAVTIHRLELVDYLWPKLRLRVSCASGTYIRSLVRDIGRDLGCGGHCLEIFRTAIGPFTADRAVTLEKLQTGGVAAFLLPPAEAFPPQRRIVVSPQQAEALKAGRPVQMAQESRGAQSRNIAIGVPPDMSDAAGATVGVCAGDGELIAVGQFDGDCLRPVKVLVE
jgi:tRNA pseudouridine55 synthase